MCIMRLGQEQARRCLAFELPRRWLHVQAVAARAEQARSVVGAEGDLLVAAAWLHDVGYSPGMVATGFHPLDGARYLRLMGADDRLCGLVAYHSLALLEAEMRGLDRQLRAEFEDEASAVTDALWWADLTTGPDGQLMTAGERIAEIEARYGPDDLVTRFIRAARPRLLAAVERTEERLRAAGQPM